LACQKRRRDLTAGPAQSARRRSATNHSCSAAKREAVAAIAKMSNRNFSCIIALLALATDAHGKLVIAAVLARSAYGKYVIAAVGDSVTAGDHGLPPFANEDEPPAPPSPFWKRLAPLFGVAAADAAAEEPQPSWSRMTPPGSTEEPSTPVDLAAAAPLPPPCPSSPSAA